MKNITGSLVAIVTPMHEDGAIDYETLQQFIEWQIEQGSDGIVTAGTTGESATLDETEHCEVIRQTVKFVNGRVPVIAGTGANATSEAIRLTRCAAEAGADACLLVTPYYNKPTQEGLYQHYKAVAESVDVPQILYNVPGRTCCDLHDETTLRLSGIKNIIGLKDATGDLQRIKKLKSQVTDDFVFYSGDDASSRDFLLLGGDGVITVTGNVAPAQMKKMISTALAGDEVSAKKYDAPLQGLHQELFIESSPIPSKWVLHKMGLIKKGIRLPLVWLSSQSETAVKQAMQQAGIK